jgi:hypothetical protein
MTKNTIDFIASNGAHIKRTTGRDYRFALTVRRSYEYAIAKASRVYKTDRENHAWAVTCTFNPPAWLLSSVSMTAAGWAAHAIDAAMTVEEYCASVVAKRVAEVEANRAAGYYDTFRTLSFHGTERAAQAAYRKESGNDLYAEVELVAIPA